MSYQDIIKNFKAEILTNKIFEMLFPLFSKLKVEKFWIQKEIFYAEIYGLKYEFEIIKDKKTDNIDIYYEREDGGKNIITEGALDEHDHITAPYLEKVNAKEYDIEDSLAEHISDPAISRFFLCKGDMYICHENCFVKNPCVHKQKTLYHVI